MYFRSILSGTLAAMLISTAIASARDHAGPETPARAASAGIPLPRAVAGLPGVFDAGKAPVVRLAQASDPRVTALEEQIRALNGTIEELNFQVLQMQEQMRKMQEDNEFRFQELEKKKSDAGGKADRTVAQNPPDSGQPAAGTEGSIIEAPAAKSGDVAGGNAEAAGSGKPPKTFGTITFDADGNVTSGNVGDEATISGVDPAASGNDAPATSDNAIVAALPATDDPEELYRNAYQFILSGDYPTAETGFRDHIARFPNDQKTADAHYWLGEALLGQEKYRDAAEVFLAASKDYPKSKKAPDMMLKLGISLAGLHQRDVACATYGEIGKRYPDVSGALKERIKQEQALASC